MSPLLSSYPFIVLLLIFIHNVSSQYAVIWEPLNPNNTYTPWLKTFNMNVSLTPAGYTGGGIVYYPDGTSTPLPSQEITLSYQMTYNPSNVYQFNVTGASISINRTFDYIAYWNEHNISIVETDFSAEEVILTFDSTSRCPRHFGFYDSAQNFYNFYKVAGTGKALVLPSGPGTTNKQYYVDSLSLDRWGVVNMAGVGSSGSANIQCKPTTISATNNYLYGVYSRYEPLVYLFFKSQFQVEQFNVTSVSITVPVTLKNNLMDTYQGSKNYFYGMLKTDKGSYTITTPLPLNTTYVETLGTPPFNGLPTGSSVSIYIGTSQILYPNIDGNMYTQFFAAGRPFYIVHVKLTLSSLDNVAYLENFCGAFPIYQHRDLTSLQLDYRVEILMFFTSCESFNVFAVMRNGLRSLVASQYLTLSLDTSRPAYSFIPSTVTKGSNIAFDPSLSEFQAIISMNPLFAPYTNISVTQNIVSAYTDPLQTMFAVYPYGLSGYAANMQYTHRFADPQDVPPMPMTFTPQVGSAYNTPNAVNVNNNNNAKLDVLNPEVTVNIRMNTDTSGQFEVEIKDDIGIGERSCSLSVGPYQYPINSRVRTRGSPSDGSYLIPFTFNPGVYCQTPVELTCRDIRGNVIQVDTLDYRAASFFPLNQMSLVCNTLVNNGALQVHRTNYFYNNTGTQVGFTVLVSATTNVVFSKVSASLILYEDMENTIQVGTSPIQLSLENSKQQSAVFSTVIPAFTVSTTKTYYFSLSLQLSSQPTPFLYSTTDLNYFTSRSNIWSLLGIDGLYLTAPITKMTITPPSHTDFPNITLQVSTSGDVTVNFGAGSTPIKSFILAAKDSYMGTLKTFQYVSPTPFALPGAITVPATKLSVALPGTLYYISNVCDSTDFCRDFPPFGYFIRNTVVPPTPPSTTASIKSFTVTPTSIDVMSENRKLTFAVNVNYNYDPAILPYIYIVEKVSEDSLVCIPTINTTLSTTGNSFYDCEIEVPLGWGLRGVIISVWNVNIGSRFTGTYLNIPVSFTGVTSQPVLHSLENLYGSPHITIVGANLGYIGQLGFEPKLNGNDLSIIIDSSLPVSVLKLNLPIGLTPTQPFPIFIGNQSYIVQIIGCTFPSCSGNGVCNTTSFECECQPGWVGIGCNIAEVAMCSNITGNGNECINGGICQQGGICSCPSGFIGDQCQFVVATDMTVDMIVEPGDPTCHFRGMKQVPQQQNGMIIQSSKLQAMEELADSDQSNSTFDAQLTQASQLTNFTIKLVAIDEYDLDGVMVVHHPLTNWSLKNQTSSSYMFQHSIGANESGGHVNVTIEMFQTPNNSVSFAGDTVSMSTNTFKYTCRLSNYLFASKLNTLRFTFETIVVSPTCDNTNVPEPDSSPSSSTRTLLSTDAGNGLSYGGSSDNDMHWLKMDKNQLSLYSRFTNKIIVDGKVIMNANTMAAEVDSSDTVARVTVSTPYFNDYVEIDPDYSVLTDFNREENTMECEDDNSRPWLIPVIVVACVVAVALVIITAAIVYKKSATVRMKVLSIKMSTRK